MWCVGGCGGRCVECGVNVMGMMGRFEGDGVACVWALWWGLWSLSVCVSQAMFLCGVL